MRFQTAILPLLPSLAAAITPPNVNGMKLTWFDAFEGAAGSSPNTDTWNIMDAIDTNNEVEVYTHSNSNMQISGGGTIQFVPRKVQHRAVDLGPYRVEGVVDATARQGHDGIGQHPRGRQSRDKQARVVASILAAR